MTRSLDSEEADKQLAWWTERLELVKPLTLPERSRRTSSTRRYHRIVKAMQPDLAAMIRELSRREGCTPFMTLLAAFNVLIARYCDSRDFVVVTPMSCRNRREWESLIGFFVNTVPLRATLDDRASFRMLLRQTREMVSNSDPARSG